MKYLSWMAALVASAILSVQAARAQEATVIEYPTVDLTATYDQVVFSPSLPYYELGPSLWEPHPAMDLWHDYCAGSGGIFKHGRCSKRIHHCHHCAGHKHHADRRPLRGSLTAMVSGLVPPYRNRSSVPVTPHPMDTAHLNIPTERGTYRFVEDAGESDMPHDAQLLDQDAMLSASVDKVPGQCSSLNGIPTYELQESDAEAETDGRADPGPTEPRPPRNLLPLDASSRPESESSASEGSAVKHASFKSMFR